MTMPPFGRDPEPPIPIRATITHSISKRLGLLLVVGLLLAMLAPTWLPRVIPARHTLRYTARTAGPNRDAFAVLNKDGIKPGETIQMQVSACNDSNQPLDVQISRQLLSTDPEHATPPFFFEDVHGTWPPGCSPALISQAHAVPMGTPPGRYYLHGTTKPADGSAPLEWKSESFLVVP